MPSDLFSTFGSIMIVFVFGGAIKQFLMSLKNVFLFLSFSIQSEYLIL